MYRQMYHDKGILSHSYWIKDQSLIKKKIVVPVTKYSNIMYLGAQYDTYLLFIFLSFWTCSTKMSFCSPSVLKIVGELNSGLPSKVVEDFSMATQRNDSVSVPLIHLRGLSAVLQTQFTLMMNQLHAFITWSL